MIRTFYLSLVLYVYIAFLLKLLEDISHCKLIHACWKWKLCSRSYQRYHWWLWWKMKLDGWKFRIQTAPALSVTFKATTPKYVLELVGKIGTFFNDKWQDWQVDKISWFLLVKSFLFSINGGVWGTFFLIALLPALASSLNSRTWFYSQNINQLVI